MSTLKYPNDGFMFRKLDPKEIEDFQQYALDNDPPSSNSWGLYHPVCREIWLARGLKPDDHDAHQDPRCVACQVPEHETCPLIPSCSCCQDTFERGMVLP